MWISEERYFRQMVLVAVIAGAVSAGIFILFQLLYINTLAGNTIIEERYIVMNGTATEEDIIAGIIDSVKDSVVHITSTRTAWDFFFRPVPVEGTGSGFIISREGYIATNDHVIAGAEQLRVALADGREYSAEIVGRDPAHDLAVIKINAPGLMPAVLGNSSTVKPGQFVIAIGSPYRLDNTVTLGVVSAINRTIQTSKGIVINGVIQTDAAINPGNSGGPLISTRGEVIAMNTAILTTTGGYQGIGFSIPINTVRETAEKIISGTA